MGGASKGAKTPPAPPASLKKANSSSLSGKNQTSIAGFFQKKSAAASANGTSLPLNGLAQKKGIKSSPGGSNQSLTPAPSSDAVACDDFEESNPFPTKCETKANGLPSPVTPAGVAKEADPKFEHEAPVGFYSPSRKASFCDSYLTSAADERFHRLRRL